MILSLSTGKFDVNVRTPRGTALHEAALCGKADVARTLLEAGIDAELRDQDGRTVLQAIEAIKTPASREIAEIILDHFESPRVRRRRPQQHGVQQPHRSLDRRRRRRPSSRQTRSHQHFEDEGEFSADDSCSLDIDVPDLDLDDEDESYLLRPRSAVKSAASTRLSRVSAMSG